MSVIVIGEALIDIVDTADGTTHAKPGGAPVNIAIGLGRLGHEVSILTDIGADEYGRLLLDHLHDSHVTVHANPSGRTATARAVLAPDGSADYDFTLSWNPDVSLLQTTQWSAVHIGSIAAFIAPGARVIDSVLDSCDRDSTLISFDPNIRPSIIGPHDQAVERFEVLAARSDLVKLSDVDADWLYPDTSVDEQLQHILDLGPRLVALTRGSHGAIISNHKASTSVPVIEVTVRDTIGAGDAFMTSLIHDALNSPTTIEDMNADELHRLGVNAARISGITVSREGANLPWAAELLNEQLES